MHQFYQHECQQLWIHVTDYILVLAHRPNTEQLSDSELHCVRYSCCECAKHATGCHIELIVCRSKLQFSL